MFSRTLFLLSTLFFPSMSLCVSLSRFFTRGVRTVPHTFQHINPATHTSPHRTTHFSTYKFCNTHFTTPYHTLLYAMHKFARNSAVSLRSERNPGVRTVTHDCNTLQHAHTLLLFFFYFLLLSLSRSHSLTCKHTHTHTNAHTRTHMTCAGPHGCRCCARRAACRCSCASATTASAVSALPPKRGMPLSSR